MYIFWLIGGLHSYIIEDRNNKAHILSMVYFTLMALTRPEGLFFVLVFLLWQCSSLIVRPPAKNNEVSSKIRAIVTSTVIFVFLYGLYFFWRYKFYGFLLPNTFYARSGALGISQIMRRLREMNTFLTYLLPVAALASLSYFKFSKNSRRGQEILTISLFTLLAFSFASKTEWMPGFRYELPFVPILLLFFAVSVSQIIFKNEEIKVANWKLYISNFVFLLFVTMYLLHPTIDLVKSRYYTDRLNRAHITLAKWLKQYADPNASYASWDMGAVPYYSELPRIIDIHPEGILSTYITHNEYDVNYFLSLNPSFIVLPEYKPMGKMNGMNEFYLNSKFKDAYQLIFSFAFTKDYILAVHKHRDVYIPQSALDEGKRLADQSFREAPRISGQSP